MTSGGAASTCSLRRLLSRCQSIINALERVSLGLFELLEAGQCGGEGEEAFEGIGAAFVADGQASVTGQPGDAAFDDPAVAAQFLAGLDADASQAGHNSPSLQPDSAFGTVVCLVAVQLAGLAAARSAAGPDRGDGVDQGLDSEPVRGVGRGNAGGQGQSAPVGEHMQLRARLASVDRIRSGHSAPLFARTAAASTTARDQSISP